MPKIRVSNKDRVEDDVMEEILQDLAKFEELLKERERPPRPVPGEKIRLAITVKAECAPTDERAGGHRSRIRGKQAQGVIIHCKISVREPAEGAMDLCRRRRPHQGPLPPAHRQGMGQVEERRPGIIRRPL